MSTKHGKHGLTSHGDDHSQYSDHSSDGEYELREIRPQIVVSGSSSLRRKRRQCCTSGCMSEWAILIGAFILLYLVNGLFTYALIEAMLANTYDTLVTFGVVWVVFSIVFFSAVIVMSNRKLKERLDHQKAVEDEEIRRREGIKAALENNNR